ncbi:MAG: sulfotransferase family 2 domain-containing protein [Desulfobacter sp.]|nr:MAG: sulfotransferase family 2 domain-containing protein [Desulfobacter sp.]
MTVPIIFQHIPKTAGTSLSPLFVSQFVRDQVFVCGSKDGVLTDFVNLEEDRRLQFKLLTGHVDYGIHHHLKEGAKYIAFLRDPVERVLSHYYFIKSEKKHGYHNLAQKMGIDEFLKKGMRPRLNNCMVRMISGVNPLYGQCDESMLEAAVNNISKNYIFIGFVSRLDDSVRNLVDLMGWQPIEVKWLNVTRKRPAVGSLTKQTLSLIQRHNSLDIELYNIMRSRFL